ncbi:MAG TPA: ABC transporter permease [Terriglobia bacterium]|nr:ABC transporter permease [Terriglobia bacterium]
MRFHHKLPLRFRSLFKRGHVEQELSDELRFHLAKLLEENVARGMTPEEARYAALRELGGVEQIKEECRDMRRVNYIENFLQDTRYGVRQLRRNPGFTAVALITLGLGIGANTSIFSVINALLFKPLPVSSPQELVDVYGFKPNEPLEFAISYPDYQDFRDQVKTLTGLAVVTPPQLLAVDREGESSLEPAQLVSANYFEVLGVKPSLGRTFDPAGDQLRGAEPVVVLSYSTWQREFSSDSEIIGKTVRLNGTPSTIIGVAPRGFEGLWRGISLQLWVPVTMNSAIHMHDPLDDREPKWLTALGRLKPGTTVEQAQAELETIAARLAVAYPKTNRGRSVRVVAANRVAILPPIDTVLHAGSLVLQGFVGLVLLVACANLAGAMLARAAARQREITLRAAVGAGRIRLIRQLLTECLLVSLLGGACALLLTVPVNQLVSHGVENLNLPIPLRFSLKPSLDIRVLGFTMVVATATTFLLGLIPALKSSRVSLVSALNEGAAGVTGSAKKHRSLAALVATQVAGSLLLLICAGLSLRSVWNASRIDPGFDPSGAVTASFLPSRIDYTQSQSKAFYQELSDRIRTLPGVISLGRADKLPLSLDFATATCAPEGRDSVPEERWLTVDRAHVSAGYFQTMRIPTLRGRAFTERDTSKSPAVVIVNQTLANLFWPGQDPIGQRVRLNGDRDYYEVVGVARDGKYRTLGERARPYVYLNLEQSPETDQILVARGSGDPRLLLASIRQISQQLDPKVPMTDLETLEARTSVSLLLPRTVAWLFGAFGLLGLVLASVGLYGVVSYSVNQRTREMGIRMALGAEALDISKFVIGLGLGPVLIGVLIGLAAALALTRILSVLLYGISATDLITFTGISVFLICVAITACYIPARRATKLDPMVALRHE